MSAKRINYIERYETGKQSITLIINIFVLTGCLMQILRFHKIYVPLELDIHIISAGIFFVTFILLLIEKKRFYSYCYLVISYLLLFTMIIYDLFFPETYTKLHLLRSEFFTRNLLILLPQIALLGFISGKKHMLVQGLILILYTAFQMLVNCDDFLKANLVIYFLILAGFCLASYFLVYFNQKFIKELHATNKKLKVTQQQLIQSEKMASIGTLTAGVSHEINNPLNFINGGVYLISNISEEIKNELSTELQERFRFATEMIHTGFDRINSIVQALMSFSNRGSPNLANTQINEIIDKTLLFLDIKINQKIEIRRLYELSACLRLDPSKIHLVVYNILDNAIFAVNHGSQKGKRIEILTKEENNNAVIIIKNNGPKIPEIHINQIFDPFFTTKDPGEGSGLGLSISYSIISEYKGKIFARNTKEGVSFIIEIPIIN
jgi:signal transduction histidine kinase